MAMTLFWMIKTPIRFPNFSKKKPTKLNNVLKNLMKRKKCNCWACQLHPKLKSFEGTLNESQKVAFDEIFQSVWAQMESDSTELGCLNAKIEGVWPRDNNGVLYHTQINGNLYEVSGRLVKEKKSKSDKPCKHQFKEDGGSCSKCGKTWIQIYS